jgi:hypothetical protein
VTHEQTMLRAIDEYENTRRKKERGTFAANWPRNLIGALAAVAVLFVSFLPITARDVLPEQVRSAPVVNELADAWDNHVVADPAEAAWRDWRCGGCLRFTSYETSQIAYGPYPWENSFMHLSLWVDAILIGSWWYYRTVARWAVSAGKCLRIGWVGNAWYSYC